MIHILIKVLLISRELLDHFIKIKFNYLGVEFIKEFENSQWT